MIHSPYGHFTDNDEFVITRPDTPRPFDNFLWNDAMFACLQQTGVGYMDYQPGDDEAVQLLSGIGRICDFDVHGRDGLMSRLVYIRDNETGEFWTLNWEPVCREPEHFACTHGPGYTILENTTAGLAGKLRVFAPLGSDPVELWTLGLTNETDRPRDLTVFVYSQILLSYKWGFDSYGDMIFRHSWYDGQANALIARKHPHIRPHDVLTAYLAADRPADGWDGVREAFTGLYGTTTQPKAVIEGQCTGTEGSGDSTIAALQFNVSLAPGADDRIDLVLGATDAPERVADATAPYFGRFDDHFADAKAAHADILAANHVKTPDPHFDRLFNTWIKWETLFGATWCRWGWMGYRDIVQHGFGVASFDAPRTRQILADALAHQYASGLAVRGWNPLDTKPYSDSALWVVFTLSAYLRHTGDIAFLDEQIGFIDEENTTDTALGHVQRTLNFLETNKGAHGLCLIKFGDWNDSLTGVGKEGRGESVWLTMAYAEGLRQMIDLYEHLGRSDDAADATARYERIKAALNETAWDGKWFVRCFDDAGNPIGSEGNEQAKIFLNSQSWALIADLVDDDRRDQLLASCDELLQTEIGYRLLTPTFFAPDNAVGRISHMPPGACENGTVYSHVNAFMALALLRAGLADKAYDTLKRILPGYLNSDTDPKIKSPLNIVANGYYGPDHLNKPFQMEFTWATGSVAWFYNAMLEELIGFAPTYTGIRFQPKLPADWPTITFTKTFRGKQFNITIRNEGKGQPQVTLNGEVIDGNEIPLNACGETNEVTVVC